MVILSKKKIDNTNNELYIKLSENKYVKKSLDKYFHIKEKNKEKEILTFDESKNLLFEFTEINHRYPKQYEQYKNQNIGRWLGTQKNKISGINDELYIKLSENEYVKKSFNEYLENKEKNKEKKILTFDESKNILFEFCNIYERFPKSREQYKKINIGSWLHYQKNKLNNINDELYIKLSENEYVKKSLDEYLHKK